MHPSSFFPKLKDPKKPYSIDFSQLPPSHNPMIGEEPIVTFMDVHGALKLTSHLLIYCEYASLNLGAPETRGLLCLIECTAKALEYELDYRPAEERDLITGTQGLGQELDPEQRRSMHALLERLLAELGYGIYSQKTGYGSPEDSEPDETDGTDQTG